MSKSFIPGIGPDTPTVTNDLGAKQSALPYRFDLIDPLAMFNLAEILAEGSAKYGDWNWVKLPKEDNINHALAHIFAYLAGDETDDHLGHAACRLHFALAQHLGRTIPR